MEKGTILVTGGAGFIGSHLTKRLLEKGQTVHILDNFDPFYPEEIKHRNLESVTNHPNFTLTRGDIRDTDCLNNLPEDISVIVHLAAKTNVRLSAENPIEFQDVNVAGTQNLLEFARQRDIKQFVFASSSSVYGKNPNVPWREDDQVLMPISPYASTKVSGELLGHVYSHLYGIRFIALRFFTVYGPAQRPDLAIHKFFRLISDGKEIPVFGKGDTRRDYTYIDDIINGVEAAIDYTDSMYEVINLGNNRTVTLAELISAIETTMGQTAKKRTEPEQPGDVKQTWAGVDKAQKLLGYTPKTTLDEGLKKFHNWFTQTKNN